jgi:hypothetical protein
LVLALPTRRGRADATARAGVNRAPGRHFVDAFLAAGFGLATLAVLLPWPPPGLSLREACDWQDAGRFAVSCDLDAAASRTHAAWLKRGVRIYEDGILMRWAERAADVRRENPGSYQTTGALLTLAALDRSDPRSNGRDYVVRPTSFDPLGLDSGNRRPWALGLVLAAFAGSGLLRRSLLWAGTATISAAALAVQLLAILAEAPVPVDAGYVLGTAEALARGARLYSTLLYNYTPLGAYEFSLWGRLWRGAAPPYAWYLGLVLVSEAACAALVLVILRRAGVPAGLAVASAMSCLSMMLWFDGGRVLFEPLYLVPTLAAALVAASASRARAWLAAGGLAAVGFLTKQYGGFALAGLLGFVLSVPGGRARRALLVLAGFAGVFGGLAVALQLLGVDLRGLASQAVAISYARRYEDVWLRLYAWQCPVAVIALAAPFLRGSWSRPVVRLASSFALAACLPFYFRQHQYYFLNPNALLFILFALGAALLTERNPRRDWVAPVAAALLIAVPLRGALAQRELFAGAVRSEQLRRAWRMTREWPAGQPTLLLGHPGFYAITRYRSADESTLGYRFLNECSAEQLSQGFARAGAAWIDPRGMFARGADNVLRAAGTSIEDQLARNGFEKRTVVEDRFELWTRRRQPER